MSKLTPVFLFVLPALLLGLFLGVGANQALSGWSDNAEDHPESLVDNRADNGEVGDVREEGVLDGPEASQAVFYKRAPGTAFIPWDSSTDYSFGNVGCLKRDSTAGSGLFSLDVQLPHGAEIDKLTLDYFDIRFIENVAATVWIGHGDGAATPIHTFMSSGSSGYGSTSVDLTSTHIVDNINEFLVVNALLEGGVGNGLMVCGFRVRYHYNLATNYLPAMLNQTTP